MSPRTSPDSPAEQPSRRRSAGPPLPAHRKPVITLAAATGLTGPPPARPGGAGAAAGSRGNAGRRRRRGRMTATLVRNPEQFAELGGDWDALRRRSRSATPFQSHAWLHSWWQSYGAPGRLRIVLVREDGRLIAAAPLTLTHRPLPVLVPLGGGISDFQDVLLDDDHPRAADALARALYAAGRSAVVDLREARPGAAAERVYDAWPGARRQLLDSACLELPGVPMEQLLERLAPASAKRSRRKLRRIDSLGVEEHAVPGPDVPAAVRTMLSLHERQWRGRGVTPEHLRPRFAAHLVCATRQLVESGDAAVTEYRVGGEVVASDIAFTSADLVCGYLYGAHPRLREQHVDITTMLLRHDAQYASSTGRGTLSLLRGTEPYKLRWQPTAVVNQRYLLARRELAPLLGLCAARVAGRRLAAGLLRDRTAAARALLDRLPLPSGPRSGDGPA